MLGLGNTITGGAVLEEVTWIPTDVSGLEIWLTARAADLTLAGSAVTTWTARFPVDGSYAYTQSTTANKPEFEVDKVIFDATGSDDDVLLEASDELTLDTSSEGWTIAMQVTASDWNSASQVFLGEKDSNYNFIRCNSGTDNISIKMNNQLLHITPDAPSALVDGDYYHLMLTLSSSGLATLYINNVAQTDTENFTATNDFIFSEIGGKNNLSQAFTGSFKEIMIFNEELSVTDRLECYNYMK